MCPFYRRKIKSPAWFRCVSPKHANQNYEFCGDGAHAGQFQYCSNCGKNGRKVCKYYFEPVQVQEPAQVRVPAPDRQSAPVGVSAPDRQPAPDREPARYPGMQADGHRQAQHLFPAEEPAAVTASAGIGTSTCVSLGGGMRSRRRPITVTAMAIRKAPVISFPLQGLPTV